MILRASKDFKWMSVEKYAMLRQREIDERKGMIWINKEEEKQKR